MKGFLKKGRNLLINDKQITPFFQEPLLFLLDWTPDAIS